jgi:GNAT superfamily N-acetyltransferase
VADVAEYELRPARADDFAGLVALATASADTGAIRVAPKYIRNPVEAAAALTPELEWVVAESGDGLIGGGQMISSEMIVEGELYRCAFLGSLMVHPDHRRRGIARALTQWRLDRAGEDAVIAAGIQTGNKGSVANARHWATQIFGKLILPGFRVKKGFSPPPGIELREPRDEGEWEAAAAGLARFEDGWNLRLPETGASLRERSSRTFAGDRFQRYYVAVERGEILGGCQYQEGARLQTLIFEHVPLALRALNLFLRVIPRDGELRANTLSRTWYAAGRKDVARALFGHARSLAAETGNAIGTQLDPRGPLSEVFPVKPWTAKGTLSVAVRSPVRLSEERLLSPP